MDLDFAEPLGQVDGVLAMSNLDDSYFSGERNFIGGIYSGYQYQCVEFARRYLLLTRAVQFGNCTRASEIYDMKTVENVETGDTYPFVACDNGRTSTKPAVGMVLIYPFHEKKLPWGHVAIISEVGSDWVGIAEQNQANKSWKGKAYGRKVPLTNEGTDADPKWKMTETQPEMLDALGWLYVDAKIDRQPVALRKPHEYKTSDGSSLTVKIAWPTLSPKDSAKAEEKLAKRLHVNYLDPDVPIPPPSGDSADRMAAIFAAYKAAIDKHSDAGGGSGKPGPRVKAARPFQWKSMYSPNEALGVGVIGSTVHLNRHVAECAKALFAIKTPMELVQTFGFPQPQFVEKAAQTFKAAEDGSVPWGADIQLGTLGMVYDKDSHCYKLLHAELDSLNLLIDANRMDAMANANGLKDGWRMSSFGHDFMRFTRRFIARHNIEEKEHTVYFVDFGEELAESDILTAEQKHQYTVERLNADFVVEVLRNFAEERRKEVADGNLTEGEVPKFAIEKVSASALRVSGADHRALVHKDTGVVLRHVFKMAPWETLFIAALSDDSVATFLKVARDGTDTHIFQPLWAHMASQPRFLLEFARWAAKCDADLEEAAAAESSSPRTTAEKHTEPPAGEGENARTPSTGVLKMSRWAFSPTADFDAEGNCLYKVEEWTKARGKENLMKRHRGPTDGEEKGGEEKAEGPTLPHPTRPEGERSFPAVQAITVGGKFSAMMFLEGRSVSDADAETACLVHNVVHPAIANFLVNANVEEGGEW